MGDLEGFLTAIANGETSFFRTQGGTQGYGQGYGQGMMMSPSSSSSSVGAGAAGGGIGSSSMGMLVDKDAAKQLQNCVTVLTAEEVGWIDGWNDGWIDGFGMMVGLIIVGTSTTDNNITPSVFSSSVFSSFV